MVGLASPPSPAEVILGAGAVVVGALGACAAFTAARRTRNWLYHLATAGGLLLVAGVAGQRVSVGGRPVGPWDAAIAIPPLGVRVDPVAAVGIVVALVGVTLVILFERVPDERAGAPISHRRAWEDDDTV